MAFGLGATIFASQRSVSKTEAVYSPSTHYEVSDTASELASYYSSITDSMSGDTLLSALQSLNSSKRKKTVGYSTMGTSTSGAFIYTDYDLNSTATDSNGQTYGTKVASFYTKTASTSWNREHVWPNSHGGNLVEADIHMTRPTITSENSSRGNSFYVEGKNSSSAGWDPYTAGYDAACRGECARIILYAVVASSTLNLSDADSHSTSNANPDYLMGNMNTLIKWHFAYTPNVYEMNRNNGGEYLQGNRNPFIDHPEYVARIWSSFNSTVSSLCSQNSSTYSNWTPGSYSSYGTNDVSGGGSSSTDPSASISGTTTVEVNSTTTLTAALSNVTSGSDITWTSSNTSVATVAKGTTTTTSASATVTGVAAGTAVIYCKYNSNTIGQVTVTVTSSGGSGGGSSGSGTEYQKVTSSSDLTSGQYLIVYESGNVAFDGSLTSLDATSNTISVTISNSKITKTSTTTASEFTVDTTAGTIKAASGYYIGNASNSNSLTSSSTALTNTISLSGTDVNVVSSGGAYLRYNSASDQARFRYYKSSSYSNQKAIQFYKLGDDGGSTTTKTLSSIALASNKKTSYSVGDEFVVPTVTATYSDSTTADVTSTTTFSGYDMTTAGNYTVTASYTEGNVTKTATYNITVTAKTLSTLTLTGTPSTTTYYVGDGFDSTGLTVTARYTDNTTADVTSDIVWTPDPLTAGTTSVTGTYGDKTVTVNGITVNALVLSSIAVSNATTTYYVGNSFVKPTVTATYNNGSVAVVTNTATFSGYNMSVAGNYTVSVSYTENGVTKTTSYSITVNAGKSSMQIAYEAAAALSSGGNTGSTTYTFSGTITGTVGNNFYMQDGEYGMYIYCGNTSVISSSNVGYQATVTAALQNYSGMYETKGTPTVTVSSTLGSITPVDVTNYASISNAKQSVLSNLSSGVVKTKTQAGEANSKDLKMTITVGGSDITVFASKYASNLAEFNTVYNSLSEGDYVGISNMVTSVYSSTTQLALTEQASITAGYSLNAFCLEFLNNITCDATGASAPTYATGYSWSQLSTLYSKLATADQEMLTEADANENGAAYEQVVARYDYIVAKYGYENFMNRTITNSANRMNVFGGNSTNNILLILGSISLLGGLTYLAYFLKKRKED